jgi:hypothetical protein
MAAVFAILGGLMLFAPFFLVIATNPKEDGADGARFATSCAMSVVGAFLLVLAVIIEAST